MNLKATTVLLGLTTLALPNIATVALRAQSASASLSGVVKDTSGAAVPSAKISVKNATSGESTEAETNKAGAYSVPNLTAHVTLGAGAAQTADLVLESASGNAVRPSLGDLGFPAEQSQGSMVDQARLDRRSHMLKIHQRLGLITIAPLVATIIASSMAGGKHATATGRDVHAGLGTLTVGMYFTTAYFAIRAPKISGTTARGPIRLHKALAWIHGPGMILTPILGEMAFSQESNGEKVHGIAKAHGAVAAVTYAAFGLAVLSVTIKF